MINTPRERSEWISPLAYLFLSLALLPHPLLGLLHVESSAVVAFFAFFVSGYYSVRVGVTPATLPRVLGWNLAYLAIPLCLLTASLLWRPNCGYWHGLFFFFLFPVVTTVFSTTLATLINEFARRAKHFWLVSIGLSIALGGVAFDLLLHPQFYTYNHVFGGVLGPIYDEELAIRPGLLAFRALTLIWSGAFLTFTYARLRRSRMHLVLGSCLILVVALIYNYRGPLGINTTESVLEAHLSESHKGHRFVLRKQEDSVSDERLTQLKKEIQFEMDRLSEVLEVEPQKVVRIYLYPDPETKASLVGSRETSVTPVWLRTPQIHMLEDEFDASFSHELVHVFSREFGMRMLNISPSPGLIEGLAVAFEQPGNAPGMADFWKAAIRDSTLGGYTDVPISNAFKPVSFWLGRGTVSYARAGSFVEFLARRYGVTQIKSLYKSGSFGRTYGQDLAQLEQLWEEEVSSTDSDPRLVEIAHVGFSTPALVERRCPHYVPRWVRATRRARTALVAGDSTDALRLFKEAYLLSGKYTPTLDPVLRLQLGLGLPFDVVSDSLSGQLLIRQADSAAIGGNLELARQLYDSIAVNIPHPFVSQRVGLELRRILAEDAGELRKAYQGNWKVRSVQARAPNTAFAFFAAQDSYRRGNYSRAVEILPDYSEIASLDQQARLDSTLIYHLILLQTDLYLAAGRAVEPLLVQAVQNCPSEAYDFQCRYGNILNQKIKYWFEES